MYQTNLHNLDSGFSPARVDPTKVDPALESPNSDTSSHSLIAIAANLVMSPETCIYLASSLLRYRQILSWSPAKATVISRESGRPNVADFFSTIWMAKAVREMTGFCRASMSNLQFQDFSKAKSHRNLYIYNLPITVRNLLKVHLRTGRFLSTR